MVYKRCHVLFSFRLRFLSRSCYVQFSEKHSIYHQVLLLLEKETSLNSDSFWAIPFLKATKRPHNLILRIIFTTLQCWKQTTQERPADASASLILKAASNYVPQVFSGFQSWFVLFCFQMQRSLMKQAKKYAWSNVVQSTSTGVHPSDLIHKTHDLSYTEQGSLDICWKIKCILKISCLNTISGLCFPTVNTKAAPISGGLSQFLLLPLYIPGLYLPGGSFCTVTSNSYLKLYYFSLRPFPSCHDSS